MVTLKEQYAAFARGEKELDTRYELEMAALRRAHYHIESVIEEKVLELAKAQSPNRWRSVNSRDISIKFHDDRIELVMYDMCGDPCRWFTATWEDLDD